MSAAVTSDETLVIETPERVPLHFALAFIGNRFLACALDHFIQIFAMLVVALLFAWLGDAGRLYDRLSSAPKWMLALLIVSVSAIWSGYFAVFEWAWAGQTPGKRWLKLRVIREDGRPVTFWEAAARNIVRVFDMMPGAVVVREREAQAPTFEQVFSAPTSDAALRRSFKPVAFAADLRPLAVAE